MPFLFQRLQGRTYNFERDRIHYQSFGLSWSWSSTSKRIRAENRLWIERFVVKDRIHYFQISLNIYLELPKRSKEIQPLLTAVITCILLRRCLSLTIQHDGDAVRFSKAVRPDLQLWTRLDTLSKFLVIMIMTLQFQRNKSWKQKLNWNTLLSDYDECIPRTTISQMGKPIIIDSRDYEYRVGSKGSKRTGWRCRNFHKGCKARISTLNETGHIIRVFGEHDHAPPLPKEYKSIIRLLDWNTLLSDFVAYFPRTTKTLQGKPVIIDSGDYMYIIDKVSNNSKTTGWRCRSCNKGCKARVTTLNENGYIIRFFGDHSHPPPLPKE